MDISVVIPAFNEARALPTTLPRVTTFLGGTGRAGGGRVEILVVDDGSADGTARAAESAGVEGVRVLRHGSNRGKGAAVRTGVLESRGDVVLVTDADGNYVTGHAGPYLDAMRAGADVVLASRAHRASTWRVSRASARYIRRRRLMGRAFNALVRAIVGLSLTDTQTGLKLYRGDAARALFRDLVIEGFAYDVEILCRARRRGMRIVELPLVYRVPSPESSVTLRHPPRMALDLLRVRRLCRDEPPAAGAHDQARRRPGVGAAARSP